MSGEKRKSTVGKGAIGRKIPNVNWVAQVKSRIVTANFNSVAQVKSRMSVTATTNSVANETTALHQSTLALCRPALSCSLFCAASSRFARAFSPWRRSAAAPVRLCGTLSRSVNAFEKKIRFFGRFFG